MNQQALLITWEEILRILEQQLPRYAFTTWVQPNTVLSYEEGVLEIGTPKQLMKDWLESKYKNILTDAARIVLQEDVQIRITNLNLPDDPGEKTEEDNFSVPPASEQATNTAPNNANYSAKPVAAPPSPPTDTPTSSSSHYMNPKYVFETFVVGNSNRLAHATALAVAESPAKAYNPLFIYGGVGLGKTHLMHAIGHRVLQNHPNMKLMYISSEKFTNELINSIKDGNTEAFRNKYRKIDVLLVDDIQFLSKKEHTQEEFFHTFNALHEANKQIILSSDRPPREIQTLEDRLRSRFQSGMIADIQPPDLETRIAILRKKANSENLNIPNDVMVFLASRIDNNIRELEGALIRVIAYASLIHRPIDIDLATEALRDLFPQGTPKQVTIEFIQDTVASYFKIKREELLAKKRTRNVAYPRQIAMYLCRDLTDTSLPRIGEMFGGRDHTTVIHAFEKINRERTEEPKLSQILKELIQMIQAK